jgi:hypothetical protein
MKLEIEYPAFVVAMHKGGRTAKKNVVLQKAEFELAVVTAEEAPLAFLVHNDKGKGVVETRDIRSFQGRLYGTVQPPERPQSGQPHPRTLEELIGVASKTPLDTKGMFRHVVNQMRCEMKEDETGTVLPSGVKSGLHHPGSRIEDDSPIVSASRSLLHDLIIDDDVRLAFERYRDLIQSQLGRYVSVDGVVYELCGEPIYRVSDKVTIYYPDAPDGGLPLFTYAAGNHDDAVDKVTSLDEARVAAGGSRYDYNRCEVEIEVIDHEKVTWRAEEMDFDRFARKVESSLSLGIVKMHEMHRGIRIPKSVYNAWLDLRDFLDTYDPLEGVPEELEHLLTDALDQWKGFRRGREFGNVYDPEDEPYNTMVARFADRDISLPAPVISSFRP